jgi:hypothetical protein
MRDAALVTPTGAELVELTEVARLSLIAQRLNALAAELTRLAEEIEQVRRLREAPPHVPSERPSVTQHRKYLNVADAAEFIGLAKQTLNTWRVAGDGPPYHKLGRRVLYDAEELEGWVQGRRVRHTSAETIRRKTAR